MAFLDPVNTIATKIIAPGVVDNVGKSGPLMAALRKNCLKDWQGFAIQENFLYDFLNVKPTSPGDTYDISQVQIATGATFSPKYYVVPVSADIVKLRVEMQGPTAVFDYVDLLLQGAAVTMGARLAVDLYKHGQNIGGQNRVLSLNGLDEAYNDGNTNGCTVAATFPTYGTITRNAEVGAALNSPMTTGDGGLAANVGGAIGMEQLELAWQSVTFGTEKCDLITCPNRAYSYIKMAFASQQRFESTDGQFGFKSIAFNGSEIIADRYCPGSEAGSAQEVAKLGTAAIPTGGESIWFHNTKYLRFYLSPDPLMGFGFEPFIPAQDNGSVVGKYRFAGNVTCTSPRMGRVLYNVTA